MSGIFDGLREHHEPQPSRVRRGVDIAVEIIAGAVLAAVVTLLAGVWG